MNGSLMDKKEKLTPQEFAGIVNSRHEKDGFILEQSEAELILGYEEGHGFSIGLSKDGSFVKTDTEGDYEDETVSFDDILGDAQEWSDDLKEFDDNGKLADIGDRLYKAELAKKKATDFVLEKLGKAGIEVVTDKAEFEKILANTERLQKMVVASEEFDKKNKEIARLKDKTKKLSFENKKEVQKQDFIDFQISAIGVKKYIQMLPDEKDKHADGYIYKDNVKKIKWTGITFAGEEKFTVVSLNDELWLSATDELDVEKREFPFYNLERKELIGGIYKNEKQYNELLEKFKETNSQQNGTEILVKVINRHLDGELKKLRAQLNKELQEHALLKGKDIVDLTKDEQEELKAQLKSLDYENVEGVLVHKSRLDSSEVRKFIAELTSAKLLADRNYEVYMLPEKFVVRNPIKNKENQYGNGNTPDTLTNNEFLELKQTENKIGTRYKDSLPQANNVLIRVKGNISPHNAKRRLENQIDQLKKRGIKINDGSVIFYMDKIAMFFETEIKNGEVNITSPSAPGLADETVVPPINSSLSQSEDLSSKKTQHFIHDGTAYGFTPELVKKKAMDFVLEKLGKAGIEVVTDKAVFDKILANTERLQKMKAAIGKNHKTEKFVVHENLEEINSIEVANELLIGSIEERKAAVEDAQKRTALPENLSAANMFSYKGLNYIPVRNFETGENRDVHSKHRFNGALAKEPATTKKFLITDFYNAAGRNGNADVFYCVQRGGLCFPSANGIFVLSKKFNKNKKGRNEFLHDYDAETKAFRAQNGELLAELNDIALEEKNDRELMKSISEVLEFGEIFNRKNETLGDVRIRKGSGTKADGILHIAERRLSRKVFNQKKELEQAFRETTAIIFCAINNVDKVPAVKETDGHYATYKNGIKTVLKQDLKKGAYLVTGFDLDTTSKEAADTIEAVIANYGYAPEFLGIYTQVGAAYSSLYQSLPQSEDLSSGKIQHSIQNKNTKGFTDKNEVPSETQIKKDGIQPIIKDSVKPSVQAEAEKNIPATQPKNIVQQSEDLSSGKIQFMRINSIPFEKFTIGVDNIKTKVRGGAAISPLTRQPNVDAAAISASGEPNISISEFADKSIDSYVSPKNSPNELIAYNQVGETVYGFTHNNKIYLNPDVMDSEAAVHEYTHLWDAYIQRTNPGLWQKGKDILSKTRLWEEVKNDEAYADIADDEDLVLSEVHSRICGKIAAQVLERMAAQDGEMAKDSAIDWDKEASDYLFKELQEQIPVFRDKSVISKAVTAFMSMPMVDLMTGKDILQRMENRLNHRDSSAKDRLYKFIEKKLGTPAVSREAAAAIIYSFSKWDYTLSIEGNELYEVDTLYNVKEPTTIEHALERALEFSTSRPIVLDEKDYKHKEDFKEAQERSASWEKDRELLEKSLASIKNPSEKRQRTNSIPNINERRTSMEKTIEEQYPKADFSKRSSDHVPGSETEKDEPAEIFEEKLANHVENIDANLISQRTKEIILSMADGQSALRMAELIGNGSLGKEIKNEFKDYHENDVLRFVAKFYKDNGLTISGNKEETKNKENSMENDYETLHENDAGFDSPENTFTAADMEHIERLKEFFGETPSDEDIKNAQDEAMEFYDDSPQKDDGYSFKDFAAGQIALGYIVEQHPELLTDDDDFGPDLDEIGTKIAAGTMNRDQYVEEINSLLEELKEMETPEANNEEEIEMAEKDAELDSPEITDEIKKTMSEYMDKNFTKTNTGWEVKTGFSKEKISSHILDDIASVEKEKQEQALDAAFDTYNNEVEDEKFNETVAELQNLVQEKHRVELKGLDVADWLGDNDFVVYADRKAFFMNQSRNAKQQLFLAGVDKNEYLPDEPKKPNDDTRIVRDERRGIVTALRYNPAGNLGIGEMQIAEIPEAVFAKNRNALMKDGKVFENLEKLEEFNNPGSGIKVSFVDRLDANGFIDKAMEFEAAEQWNQEKNVSNEQKETAIVDGATLHKAFSKQCVNGFTPEMLDTVIEILDVAEYSLELNESGEIVLQDNQLNEWTETTAKDLLAKAYNLTEEWEINGISDEENPWYQKFRDAYENDGKPELLAPNGRTSELSEGDYEYVHSDEFKERFGDWEKAWRLEKLANSEPVVTDGKILLDGKDITNEINDLRQNRDIASLKNYAKQIGGSIKDNSYINDDTQDLISVSGHNIREVSNHNIKDVGHIESISLIPEIIKKGIFIAEAKNENKDNKGIEKYKYLVTGMKVNGTDYTAKSVIGVRKDGTCYYDHKLSEIEKGTLVSNLTSLLSNEYKASAPLKQYDKRLLQICQCLQKQFLTENFEPKKEVIEQVRNGKTIYELSEEKPFTEFTAWKITDKKAFLEKYPPVLENVFSDHITNQFGLQLYNNREGEKQTVEIYGRLTTENVDVLLVKAESENIHPHITLSAKKGFSPVNANQEIAEHLEDIEMLSDNVEVVFTNYSEKNLAETQPLQASIIEEKKGIGKPEISSDPFFKKMCDVLESHNFGMKWDDSSFSLQWKDSSDKAWSVSTTMHGGAEDILESIVEQEEYFDVDEFADDISEHLDFDNDDVLNIIRALVDRYGWDAFSLSSPMLEEAAKEMFNEDPENAVKHALYYIEDHDSDEWKALEGEEGYEEEYDEETPDFKRDEALDIASMVKTALSSCVQELKSIQIDMKERQLAETLDAIKESLELDPSLRMKIGSALGVNLPVNSSGKTLVMPNNSPNMYDLATKTWSRLDGQPASPSEKDKKAISEFLQNNAQNDFPSKIGEIMAEQLREKEQPERNGVFDEKAWERLKDAVEDDTKPDGTVEYFGLLEGMDSDRRTYEISLTHVDAEEKRITVKAAGSAEYSGTISSGHEGMETFFGFEVFCRDCVNDSLGVKGIELSEFEKDGVKRLSKYFGKKITDFDIENARAHLKEDFDAEEYEAYAFYNDSQNLLLALADNLAYERYIDEYPYKELGELSYQLPDSLPKYKVDIAGGIIETLGLGDQDILGENSPYVDLDETDKLVQRIGDYMDLHDILTNDFGTGMRQEQTVGNWKFADGPDGKHVLSYKDKAVIAIKTHVQSHEGKTVLAADAEIAESQETEEPYTGIPIEDIVEKMKGIYRLDKTWELKFVNEKKDMASPDAAAKEIADAISASVPNVRFGEIKNGKAASVSVLIDLPHCKNLNQILKPSGTPRLGLFVDKNSENIHLMYETDNGESLSDVDVSELKGKFGINIPIEGLVNKKIEAFMKEKHFGLMPKDYIDGSAYEKITESYTSLTRTILAKKAAASDGKKLDEEERFEKTSFQIPEILSAAQKAKLSFGKAEQAFINKYLVDLGTKTPEQTNKALAKNFGVKIAPENRKQAKSRSDFKMEI